MQAADHRALLCAIRPKLRLPLTLSNLKKASWISTSRMPVMNSAASGTEVPSANVADDPAPMAVATRRRCLERCCPDTCRLQASAVTTQHLFQAAIEIREYDIVMVHSAPARLTHDVRLTAMFVVCRGCSPDAKLDHQRHTR